MPLLSDVAKMNDEELQEYFNENAVYREQAPPAAQYGIRFGRCFLTAPDTDVLFAKFREEVRKNE